jgi:hypothetical protein
MLFSRRHVHDVFLSHAVEDKPVIADELYGRLHAEGLRIWYSGKELSSGRDIQDDIEKAIENSRFGIIIYSNQSVNRPWLVKEQAWLQKKEKPDVKVILPILHDLTIEEFRVIDPGMAQKFCIQSRRGMDYVVDKLLDEIKQALEIERQARRRFLVLLLSVALFFVLILSAFVYIYLTDVPTDQQINDVIETRLKNLDNTIKNRYLQPIKLDHVILNSASKIDSAWTAYQNVKSYYRNEYEFTDGDKPSRGRKNVETVLQLNLTELADLPAYGMISPEIYWIDGIRHASFSLVNNTPIKYKWAGERNGSDYLVSVEYTNNIQYINVSLTVPPTSTGTRRHEMTLVGLMPIETYHFEKASDGTWQLKDTQ